MSLLFTITNEFFKINGTVIVIYVTYVLSNQCNVNFCKKPIDCFVKKWYFIICQYFLLKYLERLFI